ncbi:extracellular solute-binding protein [Agromyces sp. SYSU T00194]|uniref:extracellular solute-binding protein n=1 Tax=Agromyces chitinivorans TaxID=3158560 RepID=UPI003397C879
MSRIQTTRSRLVAGVAALGAASLALTGCTAGGGGGGDDSTITVMWASNELSEEQIAAFEEENPDLTVEFIEFDFTRLNAMITAGDAPDVVRGNPSANLFARGLATNLDDFVAGSEAIQEDDLLPVNDAWRWDGTTRGQGNLYGIVKDWSPDTTIWQNSALFDSAGVEPLSLTEASDWDEVLAKATELKDAGVEYPLGIEWQWGVINVVQNMVAQQGGDFFNEDFTEIDLGSPEAQRAIQWLIDFGDSGVGPTSLNPLTDGYDLPVFASGRMATTVTGYWMGGGLQGQDAAAVAETSTLAPAPTYGERISPVAGGVGGWIPEGSDNKDGAWRFMEYYMAGAPAEERAATGWGLPSLQSLWDLLPADEPYQQQAIETATAEIPYVTVLPDSPYATFEQLNEVVDRHLQQALQGEMDAAEVGAAAEEEINTLLAQGKDQLG